MHVIDLPLRDPLRRGEVEEAIRDLECIAAHKILNCVASESTVAICDDRLDDYLLHKLMSLGVQIIVRVGNCVLLRVVGGYAETSGKLAEIAKNVTEYTGETKI